jgi:CheY-like chemotaxis protein
LLFAVFELVKCKVPGSTSVKYAQIGCNELATGAHIMQSSERLNQPVPAARRAMLIDDDKESVETLSYAIESLGYCCSTFSDPHKAIQKITNEHFDVVITDMQMPGLSGIEVVKEVRKISPESFIIVVSGSMDHRVESYLYNHGASLCLPKPFHLSILLKALSLFNSDLSTGLR